MNRSRASPNCPASKARFWAMCDEVCSARNRSFLTLGHSRRLATDGTEVQGEIMDTLPTRTSQNYAHTGVYRRALHRAKPLSRHTFGCPSPRWPCPRTDILTGHRAQPHKDQHVVYGHNLLAPDSIKTNTLMEPIQHHCHTVLGGSSSTTPTNSTDPCRTILISAGRILNFQGDL